MHLPSAKLLILRHLRTKSADGAGRRVAWLLLVVMAVSVAHPLLRVLEARSSTAYADWLGRRGFESPGASVEAALREAASRRHTSIEGFVADFVDHLEDSGALSQAAVQLLGPSGLDADADDLFAALLDDLRSLSPKEPVQTARLNPADGAGLPLIPRVLESRERTAQQAIATGPEPVRVEAHGPNLAEGLSTSIQSLGP